MIGINKYVQYAAIIIVLLVCYVMYFHQLGALSLRTYDESRNAMNAIEMYLNHNYLIRYFDGKPDMWETKPPLLVWLQVISIHIFGFANWVYRLPSALAATGTVVLIYTFLYRRLQSVWPGFFAAIILTTSQGYLLVHGVRSADHEALLIFFETAAIISFYNYVHGHTKTLGWTVLCIILGIFTKSIAMLFIGPALVLYMLFTKSSKKVFGNYKAYIYVFIGLVFVAAYYLLRERYNPGYLNAVAENELWTRYSHANDTGEYRKVDSLFVYAEPIVNEYFFPWVYLFIPCIIAIYIKRERESISVGNYFLLHFVVFYLIISFGIFKEWYSKPVFPMLAILMGVGFYKIIVFAKSIKTIVKPIALASLIIVFAIFSNWAFNLSYSKFFRGNDHAIYQYGYFYEKLKKERPHINSFITYDTDKWDYNGSLWFYNTLYNGVYGYHIKDMKHPSQLHGNTYCIAVLGEYKSYLESHFYYTVVDTYDSCTLYWLGASK